MKRKKDSKNPDDNLPADDNESENNDDSANDLVDLSRLRLSQNFGEQAGVKKVVVTIPIRKPDRQWFLRVHPEWRFEAYTIQLHEEKELYIVDQDLHSGLSEELVPTAFFPAITRQDALFLWPIRLPGSDGKHNEWHRTATEAAHLAITTWLRVSSNMSLRAYDVFRATGNLPEPAWPDMGFESLLQIAFKDRVIRQLDHPVIRRLRGEI